MDDAERLRCVLLHEKLTAHALAWPFLEPVDPVALNVPTYFDVITHPMDFRTMARKLGGGEYDAPEGYRADLVLMFQNAIEFNKDDTSEQSVACVAALEMNMARRLMDVALAEWDAAFSEEAATDWIKVVEQQAQARLIQEAKDARMVARWKRDSFVARFNRDKIALRRQYGAEATG